MKNVKQKIIAAGLVVCSLLLIGLGYIFMFTPHILGLCMNYPPGSCYDSNIVFGIGGPLYRGIRVLPFLFLLLFFIRADVFKLWWKFAIPFALFALYTILSTSPEGGGGFLSYSRTQYTYYFAWWFTLSSLLLIALKTWRQEWRSWVIAILSVVLALVGIEVYIQIF